MQTPKVFVTGVTGYVGGDAMIVIMAAHPTWQYSFLVRNPGRVADLVTTYPKTRIVTGDLSDTALIKDEVTAANIIMTFASSDDVPSAEAVRAGLTSDNRTRFWIHTSGTANLLHDDRNRGVSLGELSPKIWDDVQDIRAINDWSPETVLHRDVEKIVLESSVNHPNVKPAVICPPVILGMGRGPGNKRSIQVPILIELIRQRRRAFQVGQGKARWGFVHVHDLSELYLLMAEAAASGGSNADWGSNGYYFAENGEMEWGSVSARIGARLHEANVLKTKEVDSVGALEASRILGRLGPESVGGNSRSRATRPRKLLKWAPKIADLDACIDEQIAAELTSAQSRLQDFKQGHMPKLPASGRLKL